MNLKLLEDIVSIEEINIKVPSDVNDIWITTILGKVANGEQLKFILKSHERYAHIWSLTHDFEKIEIYDQVDDGNIYDFGQYRIKIYSGGEFDEQWIQSIEIVNLNNFD